MDPNKGVGAGWDLLSDGWDSNTKSMEVNWDVGPDYNPPCVVIGLADSSIWFYDCMNPYWYQLEVPDKVGVGGFDSTLLTLKAQFIDNGDDTLTVTVIAGLENGDLEYGQWTTNLCGISGGWYQSAIASLGGPAQFLEVQWPDLESTSQFQYFKIVAGVGCGTTEITKSNYQCNSLFSSCVYSGGLWTGGSDGCDYCSECTGQCNTNGENCGYVWFNGNFNPADPTNNWRNLGTGNSYGNYVAAMKVGFTGSDFYPAIVVAYMGYDIYYWNYANQNGGWEAVFSNSNYDDWVLPINLEVQFPFENSDSYLKVVSSGGYGFIQYNYALSTSTSFSIQNQYRYITEEYSYDSSGQLMFWGAVMTTGLCANFGGYNGNAEFPIVIAGNGWLYEPPNSLSYPFVKSGNVAILTSPTENITLPIGANTADEYKHFWNYGVVAMQCSWENFPDSIYPEILVPYNNASGYYYNPTPISTGCPCSNENGATYTCPCPYGNFTSFAGPTWDNTFMSVFNSSFPTPGSPKLVGGLTQIPAGSGILSWLECEVCESAVGAIFALTSYKVFNVRWCNSICPTEVQAAGGGPEDPVADVVTSRCWKICKVISSVLTSTITRLTIGKIVCDQVGMCTSNSCGSGSTSTTTLVQSDTFTLDLVVGKHSRRSVLDMMDEKGAKADKSEAKAGKSSMASQSALEEVLRLNLRKCDDDPDMPPMLAELEMLPCQKVGKRSRRVYEYQCKFHLEFTILDSEDSEANAKEVSNDCIETTLQQTDVLKEISVATGSNDFVIKDEGGEIVSYKISKSKNSSTNEAAKAGKDGKSSQAEAMGQRHRTREHTKSGK